MMIHPGACRTSPFDILDVLEEAHADLSQVAFAHLERTLSKTEDLLRLAGKGCYLEFDLFGAECSHSQVSHEVLALSVCINTFLGSHLIH